jgi:hypothetical protein
LRIQPRQQLLDIWRSAARVSYHDGCRTPAGRDGSNSISDAEQLLCVTSPATELPLFRLDLPDSASHDVVAALQPLSDEMEVQQCLLRALSYYIDRYTAPDGTPDVRRRFVLPRRT